MNQTTLSSCHRWLHANLLLPAVAALTLGVALAHKSPDRATSPWWLAALAICAAATLFLFHYRKTAAVYTISATFFVTGVMHAGFHLTPPRAPQHIYNMAGLKDRVSLSGTLAAMPEYNGEKTKFEIKTDGILQLNAPAEEKRRLQPITGLVRLTFAGKLDDTLMPGDHLLVRAVIGRIHDYRTPGTFSFRTHLATRGIHVSGWIDSPADIVRLRSGPTSLFEQTRYLAERTRTRIAAFLDNNLDQTTSGLYQALLIGSRARLPARIQELYQDVGCMHLLAISGLHLSLLAVMTTLALTWLLKRSVNLMLRTHVPTIAAVLSIIPLIGYAYIAGMNPPVLRALLMAILAVTALCLRLRHALAHLIAAAALFILAFNPLSLYGASFQLSMSAVLAIALIAPRLLLLIEQRAGDDATRAARKPISFFSKAYAYIRAAFLVSVAATAGTLPFMLLHFNRFSLVGPLGNLLIEPLLCFWTLPLGLLATALIPIYPPAALFLLQVGAPAITASEYAARALQHLPFCSIRAITPNWLEITGYYATLSLWYWRRNIKHGKIIAAVAALVLLSAYTRDLWLPGSSTRAKVSFIDVGQGAATLIQSPRGRTVLVDAGGPASSQFNVGEFIVGPFLRKNRIWRLDDVVISHAHADHFNGMDFIIRQFRPRRLWTGERGAEHDNSLYEKLLADAAQLGVEVLVPGPGQCLMREPNIRLVNLKEALLPGATGGATAQDNDHSLILRLEHGDNSFLLPGDISAQVESRLVRRHAHANLRADVLLAPHHGSKNSCDRNFIRTVKPAYIIVSAGRHGAGRYPFTNHLRDWKQQAIQTLITREDGTILCLSDGKHLTITTPCAP